MESKNNTKLKNKSGSRRSFLKYFLTIGVTGFVASVFYPLFSYLKPPEQNDVQVSSVKIGAVDELEKDSSKIIRFGRQPVIVIKTSEGNVRAFSAECTHLDCTVQYRKDMGVIWCACHNGKYDLNGRNISGPPPRPLEEFKVLQKGKELFVSKNS